VGVRVQFVQGRAPLQLTLPFPLPTVGELKRRVHEAYGGAFAHVCMPACFAAGVLTTHLCLRVADIAPERQRLVFAGQILAPDDKDLALVKVCLLAKHCRLCTDKLTRRARSLAELRRRRVRHLPGACRARRAVSSDARLEVVTADAQ
jgi:hypothetical protein